MKINSNQSKLKQSLDKEEKTIEQKSLGTDKFHKADLIFNSKNDSNAEIKVATKPVPGIQKTIYMSQDALKKLKDIGSRLRKLDVVTNDSKIIAAALFYLDGLDDVRLIAKTVTDE